MDDIKKMFRTIVNGQSAMKQELLKKIEKLDGKVDKGFHEVNRKIDKTNERLDKIGKSVAYLEDDAPIIKEFDNLKIRVTRVEKKIQTQTV